MGVGGEGFFEQGGGEGLGIVKVRVEGEDAVDVGGGDYLAAEVGPVVGGEVRVGKVVSVGMGAGVEVGGYGQGVHAVCA